LFCDDLGLHEDSSRKAAYYSRCVKKKCRERAKKLLLRKKKESSNIHILCGEKLFTTFTEENYCNSRYLSELPVSGVDRNVQIGPNPRQ
jgi:hypothetical protein